MSKIRKIAVFVSHIYGEYQRNLCQGVIDKATEFGYNVDIFVSNDENILGRYATGESGILKIPNPSAYDGVILSSSTYLVPALRDKVVKTLQEWNCPVIDINATESPFPRILLDNNSPIGDLVVHFAKVHSLTNIAYLGNTVEEELSQTREQHYTKAMNFLGLASKVTSAQADYSSEGIHAAIDELLAAKTQAIVCYNDKMACSVMEDLVLRNISVPKQIAVAGCDDLEFGQNIAPTLSSITFPSYELGERGFLQLLAHFDGTITTETPIVKAAPRFGGSCGCSARHSVPPIVFSNKLKAQIDSLEYIYLKNMHMSANLQGLRDIDDATELLANFVQNIEDNQGVVGLREFYLCLYSNWEQISNQVRRLTLLEDAPEQDQVLLKLAIKDHARLPECTFSKDDSLPPFLRKGSNQVYVFTPLYFDDKSFGYLCQAFENNIISYPFSFVSWLQNVNSMLQTISDNRNMQLMLDRLEDIYSHDSLTGLLNLQSFNMMTPNFIKMAEKQGTGLVTIVLDLDYLKQINDKYGHAEGNFAIQVLGQAINKICTSELMACRFGGDEFYLVGTNLSDEAAERMILRVQTYLEHYNDNNKKAYRISVSGGYANVPAYTEEALQDAFKIADRNMYRQKQLRHESKF
uniref:diguanylate cyclase domain-containing protein n=1 Tax=Acetatifactor sp. TaxID=1872090 RepID=UPI0040569091